MSDVPARTPTRATPTGAPAPGRARTRLDHLVSRSRWALGWERIWPRLWGPLGVLAAFLLASWLGLWLELTPAARQIGVAAFGLILLLSTYPLWRLRRPSRPDALARLDRGAAGHRPASALEDTLALGSADPASLALWQLHRRRAEAAVADLQVARPRPEMTRRDPFAIRSLALLAAVAALFVAGPDAAPRLAAAFDWRVPDAPGPIFRVDGWIDPPIYTRLPPLMIDLAAGEQHLKAPVGSILVVRVAGRGDADLQPGAGLAPLPAPQNEKPELSERRFKVTATTELGIRTGLTKHLRLFLDAVPDHAPEIALTGPPEAGQRGSFTLAYKARDDYGLAAAEAVVANPGNGGRRSLVPPPRVGLTLPADPRTGDETKSVVDLTEHPWAGARVKMTLVARDEAGQEGRSATIDYTLPQRPFTKPLAKALVEQRRNLILDPDNREPVQFALDSLLVSPDRFTPEPGVYLGLKTGSERLRRARDDADLTDVAEWLWAMALQIEEGDLTDAERALKAAQEQLREAMDRGANPDEIQRLTQELRTAMDRFLRELAQRLEKDQRNGDQQTARNSDRVISQDDLNRMLNSMQDALKRGDMAEAQRLLDQLKNILENLRTAQPGSRQGDPLAREMNRQMQDLDGMIRDQQELRDQTFKQPNRRAQNGERNGRPQPGGRQPGQRGQSQQRQPGARQPGGQQPGGEQGGDQQGDEQDADSGEGQDGQGGQEGGQQGSGLGRRQQALRERLQEMQRRMRGMGMEGEPGLSDAEGAMRDAEGQLGQGQRGGAVDSQGRALEGLQRGMQSMAQQMQQMLGQGEGQDQEGGPNGPGTPQGRAQSEARSDDPLGRPTRSRDFSDGRVRIPGADESGVERARRILEELRRKLGDPSRPQEELDYFERLLRRN